MWKKRTTKMAKKFHSNRAKVCTGAAGTETCGSDWEEAREKAERYRLEANSLMLQRDEAREDAAHWKAEYEIVEARLCGWKHPRDNGIIFEHEVIPMLKAKIAQLATEHMLAVNKLCNERDEAREIAQQLIHIASHCLGWHENSNPETITDAINRWNASPKK